MQIKVSFLPQNRERVPKKTRNELLLLGVLQVFAASGCHLCHSVDNRNRGFMVRSGTLCKR